MKITSSYKKQAWHLAYCISGLNYFYTKIDRKMFKNMSKIKKKIVTYSAACSLARLGLTKFKLVNFVSTA